MRISPGFDRVRNVSFLNIIAMAFISALASGFIGCGEEEPEIIRTVEQEPIVEKGLVILVEYPDVRHTIERGFAQRQFSQI